MQFVPLRQMGSTEYYFVFLDPNTPWNFNLLTCLSEWNFAQEHVYCQLANKLYYFNTHIAVHGITGVGHDLATKPPSPISNYTRPKMSALHLVEKI